MYGKSRVSSAISVFGTVTNFQNCFFNSGRSSVGKALE